MLTFAHLISPAIYQLPKEPIHHPFGSFSIYSIISVI